MLRNRSRAVTSKQGLMSDHTQTPLISPTKNPFSPISALLGSPRLFNGFLAKNLTPESEATAMSPTSILDLKNSPGFVNPFGYDRDQPKAATPSQESSNSRAEGVVGLALIDSIIEEKGSEHDGSCFSKPLYRASLFGSRLKVKIPDMNDDNINSNTITPPPCSEMSPKSPADFGIKTRSSYQFLNPVSVPGNHVSREFNRRLSLKEMELSEDYTCVTTHGPNPKTTHIFDDCIVECCCADDGTQKNEVVEDGGGDVVSTPHSTSPPPGFLSFCHTCRDVLAQDKDIYMYRGEKAFCSQECRCQEMFLERMENPDFDDAF